MSKVSRNDSPMAPEWVSENFKLIKFEHIKYFKARDLEIPLIEIFREIFQFHKNTSKTNDKKILIRFKFRTRSFKTR